MKVSEGGEPKARRIHRHVARGAKRGFEIPIRRFQRAGIAGFFAVAGETERAELAQIVSDAVAQTLSSWREDTLSAILARHKTTALDLRLAAPRLLLPEDLNKPSAGVLVLDMGAIRMTSVMQQQQPDVAEQAALAATAAAEAEGESADLLQPSTSIEPAASALSGGILRKGHHRNAHQVSLDAMVPLALGQQRSRLALFQDRLTAVRLLCQGAHVAPFQRAGSTGTSSR